MSKYEKLINERNTLYKLILICCGTGVASNILGSLDIADEYITTDITIGSYSSVLLCVALLLNNERVLNKLDRPVTLNDDFSKIR